MKVRKLTKEEIVAAEQKPKQMTTMNHSEQENHWMPQDVIQESKNKNKTALPKQVVVKKRIDKRKFQTVKIHILIVSSLYAVFDFRQFSNATLPAAVRRFPSNI